MKKAFSRRDFLKLAGMGLGVAAFNPMGRDLLRPNFLFPAGERLGRVSVYPNLYSTDIKAKPDAYAATVRNVAEDEVVENLREVIGSSMYSAGNTVFQGSSKTWVETPEGYIFKPHLQPIKNLPNSPITTLPEGKPGFWAEVTIPYVDLIIDNPPVRSPSFRYLMELGQTPRLYYSQIVWIDQIRSDEAGKVWYR